MSDINSIADVAKKANDMTNEIIIDDLIRVKSEAALCGCEWKGFHANDNKMIEFYYLIHPSGKRFTVLFGQAVSEAIEWLDDSLIEEVLSAPVRIGPGGDFVKPITPKPSPMWAALKAWYKRK